jgi:flagellar motility protein MotE (MotC chaperone)
VVTGATTPKEEPKPTPGPVPVDPLPRPVQPMPGPTSGSPSERALLERLGERREALQGRNRDLDVRERLIENAEKRLEARIGDLKAAEERVEGGPAKRGEAEAAAIKNLVTMYETMKPKDAARVFDRLPLDVLVPVVLGMNPRKMAEILGLMSPEAAEKLTVALATRARGLGETRTATALPPGELPAIEPAR